MTCIYDDTKFHCLHVCTDVSVTSAKPSSMKSSMDQTASHGLKRQARPGRLRWAVDICSWDPSTSDQFMSLLSLLPEDQHADVLK